MLGMFCVMEKDGVHSTNTGMVTIMNPITMSFPAELFMGTVRLAV